MAGLQSTAIAGSAAGPNANTPICTTAAPGPGVYWAEVQTSQTGTFDTFGLNMRLEQGQGGSFKTITPLLSVATAMPMRVRVTLAAGDVLRVVTQGSNGGGSAVYNAAISLTRDDAHKFN